MIGFSLLLGHLVGDYILQNDYLAANKTKSHLACFVHCVCYTFAVALFNHTWITPLGLVACFALHYPADRWRLARTWMSYSGQDAFATGMLSPWSVVIVDNTYHLLSLWLIAKCIL